MMELDKLVLSCSPRKSFPLPSAGQLTCSAKRDWVAIYRNEKLIFRMPRVIREPSLTEKTQTWVEIRKAVPAMKHVGVNPGEVNGGSYKT